MYLDKKNESITSNKMRYLLLAVTVLILAILSWLLFSHWTSLMTAIISLQQQFHNLLSTHINAISKSKETFGWSLIGLSFLYGVFHAAGPGHGKVIISTYVATQGETLRYSVVISFLSALAQSLTAIVIVWGLVSLFSFRLSDTRAIGLDVERASFVLVMLFGCFLALTSAYRAVKPHLARSKDESANSVNHDHHHGHDHHHAHDHHHSHCNHVHVPVKQYSFWQTLGVIGSVGLRPCSGALVVLIYAKVVGVFYYGLVATLAIGFGTGLTVAVIAGASVFARHRLERFLRTENADTWNWHAITLYLKLVGGLFLMVFGWSLYSAATQVVTTHPLL